ncbi:unnamed protein product, partial [Ectocarpus sp. 12 AP-2014]
LDVFNRGADVALLELLADDFHGRQCIRAHACTTHSRWLCVPAAAAYALPLSCFAL